MTEHIIYERVKAQVKFYNKTEGFGFAKRPNKADVFISQRELQQAGMSSLRENEWIEFDLLPVTGKSGGKAINIKKVEGK